jgi:branched-chain amino acid transport system permease protein
MVNLKKLLLPAAVLVVLGILPIFVHDNSYVMKILTLCFIWGVMAASWDLILGYANVFAFGHLAFFVLGAYVSGLLGVYFGVSPWLGMFIGGAISALVGLLIGVPCLRLEGMYLAIVTFSLQFILPTLIVWAGPGRFESFSTGGTFGLQRIPPPTLFGYTFNRFESVPWYYLALVVFIVFHIVIYLIIRSSIGLAFVALRDAKPLAKALGIDDYKYKLMVFGISAFIAGWIGAFYGHYFQLIAPTTLGLDVFLIILVMVLFGGLGVFPGATIGAFVITFVNEALRPLLEWRLVILGAIVILTMLFMPKGMMSIPVLLGRARRRVGALAARRTSTPEEEAVHG